jgi:hypothetical protein
VLVMGCRRGLRRGEIGANVGGVTGREADGGSSDAGKTVLGRPCRGRGRDKGATGRVRATGPGRDTGATSKGWASGAGRVTGFGLSRSHRLTSVRVEDSMAPVMVW